MKIPKRSLLLIASLASTLQARPDLVPGIWTRITPPAAGVNLADNVFCQGMAIDPRNPSTLYLCVCGFDVKKPVGLYKTTDGGGTWKRVGHLDEPVHVVINPDDPNHLYAVDGVRGNTQGFWISKDGGETWTQPEGYVKASAAPVGTMDLYHIAVEPGNFNHILVSYHSPWGASNNAGVLESVDGGLTWEIRNPPAESAGGYGMSVFFLKWPRHNLGDGKTWLFTAQQGGFFRTTDGGRSWSKAYSHPMTHGGNQIYCSKAGVLYSGGYQYPARSTDNGATWTQVTKGLDYSWYMGVAGDGDNIYLAGVGENRPFFVSPETDGQVWTPYQGGRQTFSTQPFEMHFDSANGIMYSSSWDGLYALKVIRGNTAVRKPGQVRRDPGAQLVLARHGLEIRAREGRYTLRGARIRRDAAPRSPR